MKNIYKLISLLLTVLMLLSSVTTLFTIDIFADDSKSENKTENSENEEETTDLPTVEIEEKVDYTSEIYATPDEKLATMRLALERENYQLYVDDYSGEVACVNTATGEKLFTNPYDVGASMGNETTKYEILSQIIVKFTDTQGQNKVFTSYEEAVLRGQIVTEPIKNGLRVEYTIGREQSKTLVPRLISYERFQKMIMEPAYEAFGDELYNEDTMNPEVFDFQRVLEYYVLYDKEQITSDRTLTAILRKYPIVDRMPVYVFDPTASEAEIAACEEMIITYCPDYTYEELEFDHTLTEYESEDENPPVFRMALEYKLDKDGLSVRLPANGIRFNESLYTLSSVEVLPYMGAGNSGYSGYNFFPDGSGALFDFEDLNTAQTRSVLSSVYGTDFAYHEITGKYQKTIRYPVFGIVEDTTYYTYTTVDMDTGDVLSEHKIAGNIVEAIKAQEEGKEPRACKGKTGALATKYGGKIFDLDAIESKDTEKRGFVAIIEEGDALASLTTYHAGSLSDYNTIKMQFTPRPKDTYNLTDSISVGTNSEWTVVSDRKYVGGYKMRYIMLSESTPETKAYDASWFGMAVAYRDYLTSQNILSLIEDDKLTEDIPLYIETFGAVETTEKILSVPVTVMAPLTTFDNILEMYNELSEQGIKNINFKLTGYANGGMYSTVPGKLKFEKAVGGNEGFQKLLNEAAKITESDSSSKLGIFPDFNFAYMSVDKMFDGYSSSKHAAKTIDDRYANKREYSATRQKYLNYYDIIVSPAYFSEFYNKLNDNYGEKYDNVKGISVSTLGYSLNSDFDEDEPYNREDSKSFTIKAFEHFSNTYDEVMTDGGNAYVWKYVDHMLDVSLDSSRYNFSANAVPFIGVVLHGSVSFAGEPLNMEGDLQYSVLKAIENGASPYFILSYQNTQALKEYYDLSKYYSIRYDIWSRDIADVYNTLNGVLYDVQNKYIVNHEFLTGERVPDADELEADIYAEYIESLENEKNALDILAKEIALSASNARESGRIAEAYSAEAILEALSIYSTQLSRATSAINFNDSYYENGVKAYKAFEEVSEYAKYKNSKKSDEAELYGKYQVAQYIRDAVIDYNLNYDECLATYNEAYAEFNKIAGGYVVDNSAASAKNSLRNIYVKFATAKTEEDRAQHLNDINDYIKENGAAIDQYNKYIAAKNAVEMVVKSYFSLDYEACYKACLAVEETTYFSGISFKTNAIKEDANEQVVKLYDSYVKAQKDIEKLRSSIISKPSKGTVDNYISALAQVAAMKELGYDKSEDEEIVKIYERATAAVTRTRTNAINAVARLDASNLKALGEVVKSLEEHVELAIAAIDVLAAAEGDTIVWDESETLGVLNEDELSYVTLQAIERARAAYRNLKALKDNERFVVIEDGNMSDVTWKGEKLRYKKDANGTKIYMAGTRETGYSYFTLNAEGELEIYYQGNKFSSVDGRDIYSFNDNGVTRYYTANNEDGYKYYTKDEYYSEGKISKFVPAEAAVHNGEKFTTLTDGTDIYREIKGEGNVVYYSVDDDGKYTLYDYYMSVEEYYNAAYALMTNVKTQSAESAKEGGDDNFAEAVQTRIERNNRSEKDEDDEEIVEETSRYETENIVAVTYGEEMNDPYKTIILNYNNYTVRVVYDGYEYTIPPYEFVVIKK